MVHEKKVVDDLKEKAKKKKLSKNGIVRLGLKKFGDQFPSPNTIGNLYNTYRCNSKNFEMIKNVIEDEAA